MALSAALIWAVAGAARGPSSYAATQGGDAGELRRAARLGARGAGASTTGGQRGPRLEGRPRGNRGRWRRGEGTGLLAPSPDLVDPG